MCTVAGMLITCTKAATSLKGQNDFSLRSQSIKTSFRLIWSHKWCYRKHMLVNTKGSTVTQRDQQIGSKTRPKATQWPGSGLNYELFWHRGLINIGINCSLLSTEVLFSPCIIAIWLKHRGSCRRAVGRSVKVTCLTVDTVMVCLWLVSSSCARTWFRLLVTAEWKISLLGGGEERVGGGQQNLCQGKFQ